ncbi:hypothetical protein HY251_02255, partial [bacterium]|nr:hypothetical protein [bacterium]
DKKAIQAGDQAADATGWEEAVQYGKRARELGSTLDNFHVRVGEDVTGWKMDSAAKLGLIALDAGRDTPGGPFTAIATAKAILNGPSTMSSLWWLERARRCLLLFDDSALSAAHPSLKEGKYELWSYLRSWLGMTGGDPSSMSETAPSAAEATGSLIPSAEEFSPASPPAPAHQSAGPAMVLVEEEETSPSRKPSHYEVDKSVESHTYYRPK